VQFGHNSDGAVGVASAAKTSRKVEFQGDSIAIMKPLIKDFLSSYPLCKGARVVDITL